MKIFLKPGLKLSALLGLVGLASVSSADPLQFTQLQLPKGELQMEVIKKSDLSARNIIAQSCKCDLRDVDALYMNKIIVRVGNNYPGNRTTAGTLRVTYHDLRSGMLKTVTKPIPPVKISTSVYVTAVNGPVLVKKSVGIKAEVIATTVPDVNSVNNVLIVRDCYTVIVD